MQPQHAACHLPGSPVQGTGWLRMHLSFWVERRQPQALTGRDARSEDVQERFGGMGAPPHQSGLALQGSPGWS